jgi:hypothetical protein
VFFQYLAPRVGANLSCGYITSDNKVTLLSSLLNESTAFSNNHETAVGSSVTRL